MCFFITANPDNKLSKYDFNFLYFSYGVHSVEFRKTYSFLPIVFEKPVMKSQIQFIGFNFSEWRDITVLPKTDHIFDK